jgi:hypothetical protein
VKSGIKSNGTATTKPAGNLDLPYLCTELLKVVHEIECAQLTRGRQTYFWLCTISYTTYGTVDSQELVAT